MTGVVREVDALGRVVIPKEIRRHFGFADPVETGERTFLEIYVEGDKIVLKRYQPGCIFCGNSDDLFDYLGKAVCPECAEKLAISSSHTVPAQQR